MITYTMIANTMVDTTTNTTKHYKKGRSNDNDTTD